MLITTTYIMFLLAKKRFYNRDTIAAFNYEIPPSMQVK